MSTMKVLLAKLEIKEDSSEFSIRSIVINQSDIDVAANADFSICRAWNWPSPKQVGEV